jgi:hypothetical protein
VNVPAAVGISLEQGRSEIPPVHIGNSYYLTALSKRRSVNAMASRRVAGRDEAIAPRLRFVVSGLGLVAVASLVLLHVSILWARITQGRLAEPVVALRWVAAAVLLVALLALRRRGVPLLWGRRALVFWLLVLVLHAGTGVPQESSPRLAPEQLLFVLPAAVAPACLLLVLLLPLVGAALAGPAMALAHGAEVGVPVRRRVLRLALASRPPPA